MSILTTAILVLRDSNLTIPNIFFIYIMFKYKSYK